MSPTRKETNVSCAQEREFFVFDATPEETFVSWAHENLRIFSAKNHKDFFAQELSVLCVS